MEIKLSARLSGREFSEICELLEEAIRKRTKVDLFCELDESFRGISLSVLCRAAVTSSEGIIKLRRVAVVGEKRSYKWARIVVRAFHGETRYFEPAHRTLALRWLKKADGKIGLSRTRKLSRDAGYCTDRRILPRSRWSTLNHRSNRNRGGERNGR